MAEAQVNMVEAQWFSHVTTWQHVVPIMKTGLKPSVNRSSVYDGFLNNDQSLPGVWFVARSNLPTASCYPYKRDAEEVNPMVSISADVLLKMFDFESEEFIFYMVNITGEKNIKVAIIPAGVYTGEEGVKLNKQQNPYLRLATEDQPVKFLIPADEQFWISLFIYVPEGETLNFSADEKPVWTRINHIRVPKKKERKDLGVSALTEGFGKLSTQ